MSWYSKICWFSEKNADVRRTKGVCPFWPLSHPWDAPKNSILITVSRIRVENKPADRNSVHKEIIETTDFEIISKN